jgi:hypothetical protein
MTLHDTETATHPPGTGARWFPVTRLARWGLGLGVLDTDGVGAPPSFQICFSCVVRT